MTNFTEPPFLECRKCGGKTHPGQACYDCGAPPTETPAPRRFAGKRLLVPAVLVIIGLFLLWRILEPLF